MGVQQEGVYLGDLRQPTRPLIHRTHIFWSSKQHLDGMNSLPLHTESLETRSN